MKRILVVSLIVIGLVALVGVNKARKADAIEVTVAVAEEGILEESILSSGNFTYDTRVQIRSEVTGRVADVLVAEGQSVVKGDILIRLDDSTFLARLTRAEAQAKSKAIALDRSEEVYGNIKRKLDLHRKLQERNLVAEDSVASLVSELNVASLDVQSAREGLRQAKATLKEAQEELAKSVFVAPISGIVTQVGVKVGETVVAGTTNIIGSSLVDLADPNSLRAELRVDEADVGNIAIGQMVKVYSVADPETPIQGKITEISATAKRIEPSRGLVMLVKVTLEDYRQTLYSGMSCRAEIIYNHSKPTKYIPIAAVQKDIADNEAFYVWTVKDDRAYRQHIKVGISNDTQSSVLSGLEKDQKVIAGPGRVFSQLREGMRLSVMAL